MIELQMIEDMRAKLISMVNNSCDDLIELVMNGNIELDINAQEKEYDLTWDMPYLLKGKKPIALEFADGQEVSISTWKAAVIAILQYFNSQPEIQERMMGLRDNVYGKQRLILGKDPVNMDVPLKIDEGLYFEAKYDTETLLNVLTKRVLEPTGCNYQGIIIKYIKQQKKEQVNMEQGMQMNM